MIKKMLSDISANKNILFDNINPCAMIDNLLKIFSNQTRSLEMLYLIEDIKPAVRLDANNAELKKIKQFCDNSGLFLEVSDFKVIKIADESKGGYSNIVKKVPINSTEKGLYHLYISKDENKAKFLKIVEGKNDDAAVGELLGYPKCCIDFFKKNKEKQQRIQNDYIMPALGNSEGFKFPFYTNHAARYFDFTLLGHFPCNFNCKESKEIAKRNLEAIRKNDNKLAGKFENTLKSTVLYTEKKGVFLLKNYNYKAPILEFHDIMATEINNIFELLNKNKQIGIIDKNKIKIENEILVDVGFMIFT